MNVFIGTYSTRGSQGIYVYRLDPESGAMTDTGQRGASASPSFLALNAAGTRLYAANEDWSKPQGAVTGYSVDPVSGALTELGSTSAEGSGPCHVALAPSERALVLANYGSGSVVSVPLDDNGAPLPAASVDQHEGQGPNAKRQEKPHAHSCTFAPDGRRFYACDLGVDRVYTYFVESDGKLAPGIPAWSDMHAGAGPRHMTFNADGSLAYVINELDSTVSLCQVDADNGSLREVEYVSTLPHGWQGSSTCADIHLHPSGRWLYGSNRGHDSLVVYSVNPNNGRLSVIQHVATGGQTPRNFAIDPSGQWLLVANQDSDNVVTFKIDHANGKLTRLEGEYHVPAPVCIKFGPASAGG